MRELADIFRRHGPEYRAKFQDRMPQSHLEAMEAIEQCRTEALGGHVYQCMECGALAYSYHACKNRHCPTGQNAEATPWLETPRELLLPVPYFLVTFTLPEELRPVARSQQHLIDHLLFQTSAATLKALALDPHYLGGQIGMVGVLHTWTREMAYHPQIHYLVPGGALSPDGSTWLSPRYEDRLVPVRARSKIFRGKFKEALTKAGLVEHVPPQVWQKAWVVHWEPAGTGNEVLTYLAPYIRRIAITNNRIEKLEDGHVTFRFKERGSQGWKHLTLPAEEFIRRFLQHVLPKGFLKVRYYGFLSPQGRGALAQIRTLLKACPSNARPAESGQNRERQDPPPAPAEELHGRKCGGPLVLLLQLSPNTRGPP
jgi:Putative transposase/Transposase zinc-binding domain